MTYTVAVVGPTASGKSALAIELAERLDGEIISCDSMQLYRGMDIGTAKPTIEERRGVTHHMLDVVTPTDRYSAADYANDSITVIENIKARGRLPIFCGGTGLYLESALSDRHDPAAAEMPEYRREMYQICDKHGTGYLHDMLKAVDPDAAAAIHQNNVKRVVRALEIHAATGKSKTEWDKLSQSRVPRAGAVVIGLRYERMETLYSRIDQRVDKMLADGLADEVRGLYGAGLLCDMSTAAQAIGYKEIIPYIEGEYDLETAAQRIKQATRRYAKRQMTWFNGKSYVNWITVDEGGTIKTFKNIVNIAIQIYTKS